MNCIKQHGRQWDEEGWSYGYVSCPPEIVAKRIDHVPTKRLLGAVFGQSEVYEIPSHCPFERDHNEECAPK
jgi:hypothetical protein